MPRKNYVIEDYFNSIDTENKAYILGFLFADGSVSSSGYYLSIDLQERDFEILNIIRTEICLYEPKYIIKTLKNKKYIKLCICSKKICDSLMRIGCVPNKTTMGIFPLIKNDLYKHFIRGYFDGDGCITSKEGVRPMVTIIGNQNIIDGIYNTLINNGLKNPKIFQIKENLLRITISNLRDCFLFYKFIYGESNVFLERKKIKFDLYYDIMLKNKDKEKLSKYKNITFDKSRNKYLVKYREKFIGRYKTEEEALFFLDKYKKENL